MPEERKTDTPETDAAAFELEGYNGFIVPAELSERIESQRDEARKEAANSAWHSSDLLAVAEWIISHDTGISSEYMLAVALAGRVIPSTWHGDSTPSDKPDLGRCLRLIEKIPAVRNCFPVLRTASAVWAAYLDNWDELADLYGRNDYHTTTDRMRALRDTANKQLTTP